MRRAPKERWIPLTVESVDTWADGSTVYRYRDDKSRHIALIYPRRGTRCAAHLAFMSQDQREAKLADERRYKETLHQENMRRRAEREGPHSLKVGDIVLHNWGWEQTNADFWQVIAATRHTVTIRPIKSEVTERDPTAMTGTAIPKPGQFWGEKTLTKKANAKNEIKMNAGTFSFAGKWDGTPARWSSYA